MADEDSGGANLSDAEKRRLRRRQKILENQGARLQKIVGTDSGVGVNKDSNLFSEDGDSSLKGIHREAVGDDNEPPIEIFKKAADYGVGSNSNFPGTSTTTTTRSSSSSSTLHSHPQSTGRNESSPPNLSSLLQELSGQLGVGTQTIRTTPATSAPAAAEEPQPLRMGVQSDGSVILPKISTLAGRVILFGLALFMSLCGAKRYLITFFCWEVAFYWLSGLPPMPPPNMFMVLVALMGLREEQLKKFKMFMHLFDSIFIDFSLFLVGVMLPHIISNVVKTTG